MKVHNEDIESGTIQIVAETEDEKKILRSIEAAYDKDCTEMNGRGPWPYFESLFIETSETNKTIKDGGLRLQVWIDSTGRGARIRALCEESKQRKINKSSINENF